MKLFVLSFRAKVGCTYRVYANTEAEALDKLYEDVADERWCRTDVDIDPDDRIEFDMDLVEVSEHYDG